MPFYDYYDDLQATGIGRTWVRQQTQFVCARLAAYQQTEHLLEIGPGHGIFSETARHFFRSYTALDINRRLLDGVTQRGHKGLVAQAPRLPIASQAFSVAFASHVIEHSLHYQDALLLVQEMQRVVQPNGLVALVAPDYLALAEDFWNCDYSHSFVTTRRRLRQLMRDAGLTIVETCPLYGPYGGNKGALAGAILGSRMMGAVGRMAPGQIGERVYKVRLTFARAWLLIGRVTP